MSALDAHRTGQPPSRCTLALSKCTAVEAGCGLAVARHGAHFGVSHDSHPSLPDHACAPRLLSARLSPRRQCRAELRAVAALSPLAGRAALRGLQLETVAEWMRHQPMIVSLWANHHQLKIAGSSPAAVALMFPPWTSTLRLLGPIPHAHFQNQLIIATLASEGPTKVGRGDVGAQPSVPP